MELPWTASDADLEKRFDPAYVRALALAPAGAVILRGLPFALGPRGRDPRWLLVDRPIDLDLGSGSATHVVVAHFSDSWRADDGHRPSGRPVGWVLEAGEPLARYEVLVDGEPRAVVDVRRLRRSDIAGTRCSTGAGRTDARALATTRRPVTADR